MVYNPESISEPLDIIIDDETEVSDRMTQSHPEILPTWVMEVFGYQIPVYQKVSWLRRFLIRLVFPCVWIKPRR